MGCSGSKVDDLPLVTLCRERKELIKAASEHRYALAAAHVSYFTSLRDMGDALRKFVDEELVIGAASSSPGSPVLTLPSDEGKKQQGHGDKTKNSSSSTSISHSLDHSPPVEEEIEGHLHLSSGSDSDSEFGSSSGHIHFEESPEKEDHHHHSSYRHPQGDWDPPGQSSRSYPPQGSSVPPGVSSYGYPGGAWGPPGPGVSSDSFDQGAWGPGGNSDSYPQGGWGPPRMNYDGYPQGDWGPPIVNSDSYWGPPGVNSHSYPQGNWGPPGVNSYAYYMKKSAAQAKSYVYNEPERHIAANGQWPEMQSGNGGFFGFPTSSPPRVSRYNQQPNPLAPPPAPPSPPRVSNWDFLNVFDSYEIGGQSGYFPQPRYGYGSSTSSPDSKEVREREGIPDLEDETEQEVLKEVHKEKKKLNEIHKEKHILNEDVNRNRFAGEGTSRAVPSLTREESSSSVPLHKSDHLQSAHVKDSSTETIVSKSSEEEYAKKKGVTFEIDEATTQEIESSNPSSLTTLSTHGTRDLQEVVREIKDEFETASTYGKEVALLLEVGKSPYQHKGAILKDFVG